MSRSWILALMLACDMTNAGDPNADASPVVTKVVFRDAFHNVTGLLTRELSALEFDLASARVAFPTSQPWVVFNKLMDGNSIEQTQPDPATGRKIGNCVPPGNAGVEMHDSDGRSYELRTCYDPSDKLVTVQRAPVADAPRYFFPYGRAYQVALSEAIVDKQGQGLQPYTLAFTVRPFELLFVSNTALTFANEAWIYTAPDTAKLVPDAGPKLAAGDSLRALRLVFSGPVDEPRTAAALNAYARVTNRATGEELAAVDAAGAVHKTVFSRTAANGTLVANDPRIITATHPAVLIDASSMGFAPGQYHLSVPVDVTDDASVSGSPEHLAMAVEVDFDVAPTR